MREIPVICALTAALVSFAEPTWEIADGMGTAAGAGTVTVATGTELNAMSLAPGADGLAFAGEGIAFTGVASTITQTCLGRVVYDVPLSATGSLAFMLNMSTDAITYDERGLARDVPVTAFTGIELAEYMVVDAVTFGGQSIAEGLHYAPYHARRGEGWLTVQMQIVEGGWTKCVKVMLQQKGADVEAFIVYAKYTDPDRIGVDFDLEGTDFHVASNHGDYGYGVVGLSLLYAPQDRSEQVFAKSLQAGGTLVFGAGIDFTFTGDAALSADGAYAGDMCISNTVTFKNRREGAWSLSGALSGGSTGILRFAPWDLPAEIVPGGSTNVCGTGRASSDTATFAYFTTNWVDVAQDVPFTSVTQITATMQGPNIVNRFENAHVEFVSNGVDRAFYQAQIVDSPWYKTVDLELRNTEAGMLQVRAVRAQYCQASQVPATPYVLTLEDAKTKGGASYNLNGYCVNQLDFAYAETERPIPPQYATLTGANSMNQGRVEVEGVEAAHMYVTISDENALPPNGALHVHTGGVVTLNASGLQQNVGYQNGSCRMCVLSGGELRQAADSAFKIGGQQVVVDGGTLVLGYGNTSTIVDSRTYLSLLEISNGGVVKGKYPRVRYNCASTWTSSGTGPNVIDTGVMMTGVESGEDVMWNVACDADLVVNGPMVSYSDVWTGTASLTNCVLVKTGTARFVQNAPSSVKSRVCVNEGAYVLGGSDLVLAERRLELNGGTLELVAGAEQSLDVLPLTPNGAAAECGVVLGEGAKLSIGENGITFGHGDTTLAVTGPDVPDGRQTGLRVGTRACLAAADLKRIRYNGSKVTQDAQGWLRPGNLGIIMIIR